MQQIKPRYSRHFRRCIVAFILVGVARLELAASCSQIMESSYLNVSDGFTLYRNIVVFVLLRLRPWLAVSGK